MKPKGLLIGLVAIAVIGFGFFFVRGPKPIIEIKGEPLYIWGDYGDFMTPKLLNTTLSGILVSLIIMAVAFFATRNMKLVPSGLQNAVEGVTEALYNMCIQMAGEKNGRRFFSVAATLFVFIWIANWMALTPIFNSFGGVEEVNAHHFIEESHVITDKGGIGFIFPFSLGADAPLAEFEVDEHVVEEIDGEIVAAKAEGATAEDLHELELTREEALNHAREEAIDAAKPKAAGLKLDYSACTSGEGVEKPTEVEVAECKREINLKPENVAAAQAKMDAEGKKFAVIFPYFRSFNTDLNSPLSLAMISVFFIEFWGITALGVFKYGGKFIRNPITDPIGAFVGFLEGIAELARLISFTFRLFGNMLAGEILLLVMTFLMPFLIALPFYGLEVFVGAVQGFVFFALTVAFGALAVASHDHEDHEVAHAPGEHDVPAAPAAAH